MDYQIETLPDFSSFCLACLAVHSANFKPTELTKHGIRTICQNEAKGPIAVQVFDVTIFDDNTAKKNIRARL